MDLDCSSQPFTSRMCHLSRGIRQEIRRSLMEHLYKASDVRQQSEVESCWKSDSGSTVLGLIPATILVAITSAAMLLFEQEFDQPPPQKWTPLLQAGMYCFTVVLFTVCRYSDYTILCDDKRFSYPLNRYDIIVASSGVLSLLVARLLCDACMPVSVFTLPT